METRIPRQFRPFSKACAGSVVFACAVFLLLAVQAPITLASTDDRGGDGFTPDCDGMAAQIQQLEQAAWRAMRDRSTAAAAAAAYAKSIQQTPWWDVEGRRVLRAWMQVELDQVARLDRYLDSLERQRAALLEAWFDCQCGGGGDLAY